MKFVAALLAVFVMSSSLVAQEFEFPKPTKEHEWLKQFIGEWETDSEATMGPDQPAMKCSGTITTTALGGFWVVSNVKMSNPLMSMDAIQTIGFDAESKKYVGSWVDSATGHLWKYEGTVDDTGKILTLEADGPNFMEPGKTGKFRDVYEFKTKDHIAVSSLMQGPDGKWISFMTGNSKRKAAAAKE